MDCDPKRPADTSATDEQKQKAYAQALAVRDFLRNLGFPEPVFADSGNGYHLLYLLDEPNDEATETLIRNLLAGLSAKFSDDGSNLDAGNFECNRVCKLYSTWARKGRTRHYGGVLRYSRSPPATYRYLLRTEHEKR